MTDLLAIIAVALFFLAVLAIVADRWDPFHERADAARRNHVRRLR